MADNKDLDKVDLPNDENSFEDLPEEERENLVSSFRQTFVSAVMQRSSSIYDKVNPEHITQILTTVDEQDKRDRDERKSERWQNLIVLTIAVVAIIFLLIYFKEDKNLVVNLIIAGFSFMGGFGFGKSKR